MCTTPIEQVRSSGHGFSPAKVEQSFHKLMKRKFIYVRRCCGSGFIDSGSGSSISRESGSGSRVLMTKKWKKYSLKKFLGRPSYRRSLQPSQENIHHFKK
jgi:hypothetical protein